MLRVVAAAVLAGLAAIGAHEASAQYRADTPVRAVADGCVARVTGDDGVSRTVSLQVWKGSCLQPDEDGFVTAYVDADDPSVLAARRWWGWWLLAAAGAATASALAVRTAVRAGRELRLRRP